MTDAPAAAPAATDGGVPAAPATTPEGGAPAAPATPEGGAPATPATPEEAKAFYEGFGDNELKNAAAARGWKTPEDVVRDHESLVKLKGVPADRLITLPEDMNNLESIKPLMQKLGLPESADKYDIKIAVAEGQHDIINDQTNESSKALRESLLGTMHEAMLPPAAANATLSGINKWLNDSEAQWVAEQTQRTETEMNDLKKEWGGAYDERMEMARRGARELGISAEVLDNLETVTGAAGLLRHLTAVTEKIGVEKFADSGNNGTNAQFFGKTATQLEGELKLLDDELGLKENRERFEAVAARRGPDYEKRVAIQKQLAALDQKGKGNE